IALLTRYDDTDREPEVRAAVAQARERGYATSHDEVITGVSSVAVPVPSRGPTHAALGVVYVSTDRSIEEIADQLRSAAQAVGAQVGGRAVTGHGGGRCRLRDAPGAGSEVTTSEVVPAFTVTTPVEHAVTSSWPVAVPARPRTPPVVPVSCCRCPTDDRDCPG